ncbi:MAG: hypothetical protein AB7N24_09020 [Dehalococcoidia bacterium]
MSLQNRVDPFGQIHANSSRGTMFGNRGGCMHREKQLIGRPWTNSRWICCVLEFKGRHREVMSENRYTELFFLDEATAFAAGHRPCMECRRGDANRFIDAWSRAHLGGERLKTISHLDEIAHRERVDARTHRQVTREVLLSTVPDGAFLALPDSPGQAFLRWQDRLHRWSFDGYSESVPLPSERPVTLLTPPSFAIAFSAGYIPAVHETVEKT